MLAFYMGCSSVYLIGCDHDFLNTTESEYMNGATVHHIDDKQPQVPFSELISWVDFCSAIKKMDTQYTHIREYADRQGITVLNATRGGYLENFPRVDYELLFPAETGL